MNYPEAFDITESQYQSIEDYIDAMLEVNKSINLTRINEFREAQILHIEDSLHALKYVEDAIPGDYADIGSGCGFPGVAIGIASGRDTFLVDSSRKKMNAVKGILEKTEQLKNIKTLAYRIEELPGEYMGRFSVVTARALSSLGSILELATPLLKINGIFIAYKAKLNEEEKVPNKNELLKFGLELEDVKEYKLSDGITNRTLVVFVKIAEPQIKLPRRNGLAQKKPIL